MKAQHPRLIQIHCQGKPSGYKTGMMLKERSTQCISHVQAQRGSMYRKMLFTSIRSRARNGRKKWPKMMISPTYHQVPFSRTKYQKVSSGILPFQMMKYWAKVT